MRSYSSQPRKQRLARYNMNAHDRGRAMAAHLSDELLKEYSRVRSLTVRKGDTVKVVRGAFKGHTAKVIKVIPRRGMISIEEATLTKADNKKVARLFRPSKVIITKLDLTDPWRREKLQKFKAPSREPREREEREEKEEKGTEEELEEEEGAVEGEEAEDEAEEAAEEKGSEKAEAVKKVKGEEPRKAVPRPAHRPEHKEASKAEHKEAPKAEHKEAHKPEHKEAHKVARKESHTKEGTN